MAALLAAEVESALKHFIYHVFVTDRGPNNFSTGSFDHGIKTGIAHNGGDERLVGKCVLREHVERGDGHDVVAINQSTILVAHDDTISIAIVRDADVRAGFLDELA